MNATFRPSLAALHLVLILLAACGDADPVTPPVDGEPEADEVELVCALVEDACERQIACGHPLLNGATDVEGCVATQGCASVAAVLESAHIVLDRDALAACGEALASAECSALASLGLSIDASCGQYLVGTLEEGEACRGGTISDCALGLTCDVSGGQCPGTCVTPTPACTEGSCDASAFCATDGACRPRVALGEACDASALDYDNLRDDPCVPGAHCSIDGVCEGDLPRGSGCGGANVHACGADGACPCAEPSGCPEEELTCLDAAEEGEACTTAFDCAAGLHCDLQAGRCAPRAGRGEACTIDFGSCSHRLRCVEGRCGDEPDLPGELPLLAEGDSCGGGGSCPLGTACTCEDEACGSRICLTAPRLGESCEEQMGASLDPTSCAEGLCDVFGSRTCVLPGEPGASCATEGLTLECASLVCEDGNCASPEESGCKPKE